jgi:type VI secretion system protein ImpA
MGGVTVEELLHPIAEGEPSGSNLEYDPAFAALERAAQGKPEQRMGDAVVAAEPPDWSAVTTGCLELLRRTHDLRVAVHLTVALLHRAGCAGFADGLAVVRGLLGDFWETVHPELDREDGNDPTMRITALSALGAPALILVLRATPLVRSRAVGVLTLRDIQGGGEAPAVDAATVEGVLRDASLEELEAVVAAARQAYESIAGIDAIFEQHTGTKGPELGPLGQALREIGRALEPRVAERRAAAGEAADADADGDGAGAAAGRGPALSGEIRSREDVVRAIDKICAYYARAEPTSPLPLLLERCKRLATASFLDIIRDLAPDSLSRIESLAGSKPE